MKKLMSVNLIFAAFLISCGGQNAQQQPPKSSFPKNSAQQLNFQNASTVLKDMKSYTEAVQKLDQSTLKTLDDGYQGVVFELEPKPPFINVYPDKAGGHVIFLLMSKDPTTGSNYLLTFDRQLPVINDKNVEVQIRTKDPENPLNCTMTVSDPTAYMNEYQSHDIKARYELTKRFLQSGTYDFDALTVTSYRARGYAFITFDLKRAEVVDKTANLTAVCTQ
jgi:hypothetical protein